MDSPFALGTVVTVRGDDATPTREGPMPGSLSAPELFCSLGVFSLPAELPVLAPRIGGDSHC